MASNLIYDTFVDRLEAMTVFSETLETRMEEFAEASRRKSLRVTHQRIEIYRVVASMETHPDADAVFRRVKRGIPTIALGTVYRNLKFPAEHGQITIVGLSQECLRSDGKMDAHDHFVCTKCGMTRDFGSKEPAKLSMPREAEQFGKPVSVHLEVKEVCNGSGGLPGRGLWVSAAHG